MRPKPFQAQEQPHTSEDYPPRAPEHRHHTYVHRAEPRVYFSGRHICVNIILDVRPTVEYVTYVI